MSNTMEIKPKYDYSKEIYVTKNDVLGNVAKWCVMQSPYDYPEKLPIILTALSGIIKPYFVEGIVGMVKTNCDDLRKQLKSWLEQIPEFMELNNRKNGREGFGWVSRYDNGVHPDDDFIDLDALYRNVAHSIYTDNI